MGREPALSPLGQLTSDWSLHHDWPQFVFSVKGAWSQPYPQSFPDRESLIIFQETLGEFQ